VATVSQEGMVTGVAVGQVTITATSQGQSGAASVTVTAEADGPEDVRAAVSTTVPKSTSTRQKIER